MQDMIDSMQKSLNKIKMSTWEIISDPFVSVCRWRKKGRQANVRLQILEAGNEKKARQMDLVNIMHKVNFSYDILRNFVTKDQKKLLNFNKSKVIDIYESEEDNSSSDPEFQNQNIKKKVKVSKLLEEDGFIKKLNNSVI